MVRTFDPLIRELNLDLNVKFFPRESVTPALAWSEVLALMSHLPMGGKYGCVFVFTSIFRAAAARQYRVSSFGAEYGAKVEYNMMQRVHLLATRLFVAEAFSFSGHLLPMVFQP